MNQPSSASESNNPSQPNQTQLQLVVHAGPLAGKGFPILGEALTFGRDEDNDIPLDDEEVSRYHARLSREGNKVIIEDLGSTNGTLVNGEPITGQYVIQPTDIISIGTSLFGVKGFSPPTTVGLAHQAADRETFTPSSPPPSPPHGSPHVQGPSRPPSNPQPHKSRKAKSSGFGGTGLFIMGAGLVFVLAVLMIGAATLYLVSQGFSSNVTTVPTVVITAPVNNSQVSLNQPVTIQATATDPNGILRAELWVAGRRVDEETSPSAQGQPTLTAAFQWTPPAADNYSLEVRAYNTQGAVNAPATVTINVIDQAQTSPTNTNPPTPGADQPTDTPTPPAPSAPSLRASMDLNVRAGPGTEYDLLGLLPANAQAEILAQDETRQWWQIRFAPAVDSVGWVSADSTLGQAENVENIPIVRAPPTPTGTPTPTSTPTNTNTPEPTSVPPTFTPLPPTNTPLPTETPTATPSPLKIEFDISPTEIELGDCVNIEWKVEGVKEIYLQDRPIVGSGNVEDCPRETTTYELRVVKADDTEETEEITVIVTDDDIHSAGTMTIRPNNLVDLDDEDGDNDARDNEADFEWFIEDETRHFQVWNDAQMTPMGDADSLNELSWRDCSRASYGEYTYIDASNEAPDPTNTLINGRIICYITNEGRTGKLRFPTYSTDRLTIEWVTWKE